MKRIVLGLLAASAAGALLAPAALAHGGSFRGPGGSVPPGLREPSDPTPPPPPPPSGPPPTQPPETTPPSQPPPTQPPPVTPPSQPPSPTTPDEGGQGPRKQASIGYENWTFWWGNNKDDILNVKEAIYRLRLTPDSPLATFGGTKGNTHDATRATEKQVKDVLIPALLWAMDPKNKQHPDTESAAYLALAKVTSDPAHIRLIMKGVNSDRDKIVRESAALALGLIRRGEGRQAFDARELDTVRDFCFDVFTNNDQDTRTRAFAMFAIGLLGDQPTLRGSTTTTAPGGGLLYAPDPAIGAPPVSVRIWELMKDVKRYANEDLPVSLLLSLSLQREDTITQEMTETLATCAVKGKFYKDEVSEIIQSYAALTLGRVGNDVYIDPVLNAMNLRTGLNVKRSAAIALGQLGRRVDGPRRAEIATSLLKAVEAAKDPSTKNFGIISLAYLMKADIEAQRTDVLNAKGKITDYLVSIAEKGSSVQRPFGALALGIVGRAIGEKAELAAYGELRKRIEDVLREGLKDSKIDKRTRAGFAVSLGLIGDSGSIPSLVEFVSDKTEDSELRGYSAVALGMIGQPSPTVTKALRDALRERSSEELRQQTATGLGLLGEPGTVTLLLKELEEAETQNVQGQIVLALAKIGDAEAIQPLVDLMKNDSKPDLTRALSTAGLGLIGDLEMIPTLVRISKDINYRAAPDSVNEVLTIL